MNTNSLRRQKLVTARRSSSGAVDLSSVVVGLIVAGVVLAGATLGFGAYISWSQDQAAQTKLGAVNSTEQSAWSQNRTYQSGPSLTSNGLLKVKDASVQVGIDQAGTCYVAMAKSSAGGIFYTTDSNTKPAPYSTSTSTSCSTTVSLSTLANALGGTTQLGSGANGPTASAPASAPVSTINPTPSGTPTPVPTATGGPIVNNPGPTVPVQDDWNADGHSDLLTRVASSGTLEAFSGNGTGGWLNGGAATTLQTGLSSLTQIVSPGDFNGDNRNDIIGTDSSGTMWLYPGQSNGTIGGRIQIGSGWSGMHMLTAVRDFNGDGTMDLLAVDSSNQLWLYPGDGKGSFLTTKLIGSGWGIMNALVGIGDFNGDGKADLLARDTSGNLWLYPGTGGGSLGTGVKIGSGFGIFTYIASVGDFNGDGHPDLLGIDTSGNLHLYTGNGAGGWANGSGPVIGGGFSSMNWMG